MSNQILKSIIVIVLFLAITLTGVYYIVEAFSQMNFARLSPEIAVFSTASMMVATWWCYKTLRQLEEKPKLPMTTLDVISFAIYPDGLDDEDLAVLQSHIDKNEQAYSEFCADVGAKQSGNTHLLYMLLTYLQKLHFVAQKRDGDMAVIAALLNKLVYACDELISGKCSHENCALGDNCRTGADKTFAMRIKEETMLLKAKM
jgi:hypothetical protein